jgi:PAS domain S-box-containing protein
LDHAGDEVVLIGPDAQLAYVNEKVCQSLGYSRSELLSMTVHDLDPNFPKAAWPAHWKEVKERGSFTFESIHRTKDGREYPVEIAVNHLEFGGRELNCSVAHDISERKRMQDELQRYSTQLEKLVFERTKKLAESERRFRETADLLPQIVFEIDENGKVQFMNRAAFAATGCTEEDFRKGLNAFQMFAQEDHERAMQGIRRTMTGETIGGREFTVLRRDGTTFPVIVYTAPVLREGKTVGVRGIAIDITDRKRAEEELRAATERLEYVVTSNPAVIFTGAPFPDLSDSEVTYMSDNVFSLLGFESKDFVNHPKIWYDRVHPEDLRLYLAEVPLLWKEGSTPSSIGFCTRTGRIGGYVKKRR